MYRFEKKHLAPLRLQALDVGHELRHAQAEFLDRLQILGDTDAALERRDNEQRRRPAVHVLAYLPRLLPTLERIGHDVLPGLENLRQAPFEVGIERTHLLHQIVERTTEHHRVAGCSLGLVLDHLALRANGIVGRA